MDRLPILTEYDISNLYGKQVILYEQVVVTANIVRGLRMLGINVIGYSTRHTPFKRNILITQMYLKLKYISKQDLKQVQSKCNNIIVQPVSFDTSVATQMGREIEELGLEVSSIPASLLLISHYNESFLNRQRKASLLRDSFNPVYRALIALKGADKWWNNFKKKKYQSPIIICSPQKTADVTLNTTFKKHKIVHCNLHHTPERIDREECEACFGTLKIIVGVREPISQNLSWLYQRLSHDYIAPLVASDLEQSEYKYNVNKKDVIEKYKTYLSENRGDVQGLWNIFVQHYLTFAIPSSAKYIDLGVVQLFMPKFVHHTIDIYNHPFDQEAGYTIIKEGNTEIFVYQLEKLNNIVPQLSEWIGVPFDHLEKGNVGEDKWIGDSYKQAQKEIQITQEYFDRCFDEPYVKHFYSEADIEKFKARWRPHIKHED